MVVVPRRRKRSEIPQPPGAARLEDIAPEIGANALAHLDIDDNDGTADAGASPEELFFVTTDDGQQVAVTAAMLMQHMGQLQDDSSSDSDARMEHDVYETSDHEM